jgi:hypothetical protein
MVKERNKEFVRKNINYERQLKRTTLISNQIYSVYRKEELVNTQARLVYIVFGKWKESARIFYALGNK